MSGDEQDVEDLSRAELEAAEAVEKEEEDERAPKLHELQGSKKRFSIVGGSQRAFLSAWVVDLERQHEGYTAGRWKTYCSMASGALLLAALMLIYLFAYCRIETELFREGGFIGYGDIVFTTLVATGQEDRNLELATLSTGYVISGVTIFLLSFIYIFDVSYWHEAGTCLGIIGKIILFVTVGFSFVTAMLLTNEFPAAPFMAFTVFTIGAIFAVKMALFPNVQKLYYHLSLTIAVSITGAVMMFFSFYSIVIEGNYFDNRIQVFYHQLLDCPDTATLTFEQLLALEDVDLDLFFVNDTIAECDEAFLVFAAPGIYSIGSIIFAGVLIFLYRAEKKRIRSKKAVGVEPLAQLFITVMLLSFLGIWVAASVSSATQGLGDAILTMSFVALILMIGLAVAVFGLKYLNSQVKKTSIGKKAFEFIASDWGKGLFVVTSLPLLMAFLVVDFVKQLIRRTTPLGKNLSQKEQERKGYFTLPVAKFLEFAWKWEFSSVIMKAIVWGIGYFVFSVGVTRVTLVFLSFLREVVNELSLLETSGILVGVGMIMFLLPPVPGVPVYVTAGVLLPTLAEAEGFSFTVGILMAIGLSLLMKLLALIMQQKLIGELCGSKSVTVRYNVGINSVELRAMKRVLQKKGFSFGKIAILCGGPDWPTSVLTGIMRLNVFEMLLGTLPVVFLIAPCSVSGAMLVKAGIEGDDSIFAAIETVSLFLTVVVQSGAMLAAAQVLASAAVKYEDEIKAEEPDLEVKELEDRSREKNMNYKVVTAWDNLSVTWKVLHSVNLALMIIASYAFNFFGSVLFVTFDIVDSIDEDLSGNAFFVVTELGWVFIGVFFIPVVYYFVFSNVFKNRKPTPEMLRLVEENKVIVETINPEDEEKEEDLEKTEVLPVGEALEVDDAEVVETE